MNCFCVIFTLISAALTDLNCHLSHYHSYFILFSFLPHPEPQKQPFYLLIYFSLGQGICFSRGRSLSRC